MSQDMIRVNVQLIGHEYRFACPPAEQTNCWKPPVASTSGCRDIRDQGGKLLSLEAVAVMAALNLSHELLRQQR